MDYKVMPGLMVIFNCGSVLELMPDNFYIDSRGRLIEATTHSELVGFYQDITPDGTPYVEFRIVI